MESETGDELPLLTGYRRGLEAPDQRRSGARRLLRLVLRLGPRRTLRLASRLGTGRVLLPKWPRRMVRLALRTWPFMRPLLRHLLALLALGLAGLPAGLVAGIFGLDLLTNKVLVGEKLQPAQATLLLLGDEYVVADEAQGAKPKQGEARPREDAQTPAPGDVEEASTPKLTPAQRRTVRNRLLIWTVIGSVAALLFGFAVYYYSVWIWQCVNQNLRVAMVERAESLSLKHHAQAKVGDAIFRVYQDSAMIVNVIQGGIVAPLYAAYGLLVALAIVALFDPLFALLVVVVGVPIVWLAVASTRRIRLRARRNRVAGSALVSGTQEALAALKIVKANRAETRVFRRFDEDSHGALNAAYFLRLDISLVTLAVATLGGALIIFGEYLMVSWVIAERETFLGAAAAAYVGFVVWNYGALEVARGRVTGVAFGALDMLGAWLRMQDLFIALERAFALLDIEPEVVDPADPVPVPSPVGVVAWHGVAFGYEAEKAVLTGVDLAAEAGTVTAIVGATGAGKSTLLALLLRLFDPQRGAVTINGVDLRSMALDDIRASAAIALQKNVLFADTVAANIAFGATQADRASIERAAQIADADEFIRALPNGYDTELGERGGKLSSGQRQRLSIARALVRDAPILILDEPTAALDARTERRVLGNLAAWAAQGSGRVIFLITHRLSTIKNADKIAFLESGRIAEHGTHDALMARPAGRYRAFVHAEHDANSIPSSAGGQVAAESP